MKLGRMMDGMSIKFDFDAEKFSRELQRKAKDLANKAMDDTGRGLQVACDRVAATHIGRPVEEVVAALRQEVSRAAIPITIQERNIRAYAEAIASGRGVKVQVEHLR
jgi:hypothetical protein